MAVLKRISHSLFALKQRRKLLRERKRLQAELETIKKFPKYGTSEDENAQEVEEYAGHLGLSQNLRKLLKEVERALTKFEKGTYGKCENCGKDIEIGRLEAYPSATVCVDCGRRGLHRRA